MTSFYSSYQLISLILRAFLILIQAKQSHKLIIVKKVLLSELFVWHVLFIFLNFDRIS
jgi:hypothetical protein